jgi:colanic acid/amylovoran biosynthesis glycosyltransferase
MVEPKGMKIGVMANEFPKTSKTFILNQITGMIDRGHDVPIFVPTISDEAVHHPEVSDYNIFDRLVRTGSPKSPLASLIGAVRNSADLLQSGPADARRTLVDIAVSDGIRNAGRFSYQARPILDSDLDVLHAHFGHIGRQAAKLDQAGACDAFVTMFHGWGIREGEKHGGDIYNELFEQCDCLLANTEYTRQKLIEFGADPSQVRVHHVGINPSLFRTNDNVNDQNETNTITITTVARLEKVKGIEYGILAIKDLLQRLPDTDIEYRVVGGGSSEKDLRELIQANDLCDTVTLCGNKSRSGVVDELSSSDVFLLPSLQEGFGMVLLEAQASQLPIVASDVGGIREAVSPGESAFLVPARNPFAIADRLEQLILDPKQRSDMANTGLSYVRKNFDISDLNDDLEHLYLDLLQ